MRANQEVFQYIEHELFSYDSTRRELLELPGEINEVPIPEAMVSGETTSNQKEGEVIRLPHSTTLARMERVVRAVDRALEQLAENHRRLFELRYRRLLPWPQVCEEMVISERSYFRLRRELVMMVGVELGLGPKQD